MTNENPNVDDGDDSDVDIVGIKDSMCKFAFKYNEYSYDCFQSPNSNFFQLKQLLIHTISVTNPNLQVTQIIHFGKKKQEDNVVIKNIFNTKIVHNIIIMIKNVLRQSSNEDQNSKDISVKIQVRNHQIHLN